MNNSKSFGRIEVKLTNAQKSVTNFEKKKIFPPPPKQKKKKILSDLPESWGNRKSLLSIIT